MTRIVVDETSLLAQLQKALELNATQSRELEKRNREFDALLDATKQLQDDRDRLVDLTKQQRQQLQQLASRN